ncbi:hypothetical protein [Paracoccus sp. (in: a-proteobacteria)]|uniref:hypothetical protein n=1 Tax=Paracoccus sp. TaxID=267 RepID=UPI003A885C01
MQIDDETLMALADGQLDPARAGELRRMIAAYPDLQTRLNRFQETRRMLGALRTQPQGEDPLAAMIRASVTTAVARPAAAAAPANLNRRPWKAAAASVAVIAAGLGWWLSSGRPHDLGAAELAALDSLPSGEMQVLDDGRELAMIASYQTAQQGLCREYEISAPASLRTILACRNGNGWQERFATDGEATDEDYRTASGEGSVDEALAGIGAGDPLTPEDEAAALRQ